MQIKQGAGQVVDVVNSISSALIEQSGANNNLTQQVERVAEMTVETSNAAQETAREAEKLRELANDMQSAVGRFKI